MKRSIILPVAIMFSVLSAASCTQALEGEAISGREPAGDGAELNTQEVILSAYIADVEPDTKTTIIFDNGGDSGDWHGYWSAHEHISLFYGPGDNGGSDFTSINTEPVDRTQFSGNIGVITGLVEDADDIKFWGIYPYDQRNTSGGSYVTTVIHDTQVARPNSWADGETPMIGRSDGLAMGFYNLCGFFRFFLEPIENDHIVKITFKSNDNRPIAGEVKVVMENGKPVIDQFIEPKITVSLVPPAGATAGCFQETDVNSSHTVADGSSAVWYYMTLPPNVWETTDGGITFTFYTANGKKGTRTFTSRQQITQSNYSGWSSALNRSDRVTYHEILPANMQITYTASEEILPNWREGDYPDYVQVSYESEFDQTTGKGVLTFADEITEIPYSAFLNQTGLQQIVLPESVIAIRGGAFNGCVNLTSVTVGSEQTMGSNIKTIEDYAFQNCSALTNVVLPSALENLRGDAFMNCTGLTSMYIPESLTLSNVNNPFWGCTGITRFSGKYATDDGLFLVVPYSSTSTILLSAALGAPELGPGKTCVLPALNITSIGVHAMGGFQDSMGGLQCENLVLNTNPITSIGAQSISSCPNLKSIVMPETVTYIAFNALRFNPNLEYVYFTGDVLPSSISKYTDLSFSIGITGTASTAFFSTLSSNEGWQYYINNHRLFVYQDVDEIWLHFADNSALDASFIESINSKFLGANGNALRISGFGSISSGQQLNVRQAVPFPDGISSSSNIQVIQASDDIIEVAQSAFAGATTLDYVSLPGLVTTIGDSAFEGCTQLKLFPAAQPGNITSIGERAFKDCEAMRYPDDDNSNLWLNGVTSLGEYAFYNCNSLKNVVLGQISMVPSYSFTQCTNLERFFYEAQASISSVGLMAFGGCENLKVIMSTEDTYTDFGIVNLPDVTFVAPGAFRNCKKITDVHLGAVTSIGTEAFKTCTSLEKIEFNTQNVVAIGESSFQNCANLVQVGTTANTIDFSNATSIGMNAFNGCSSIKSVHLGALQTIEAGTFLGCTSLEGVRLSSAQNLTTIKAQAFLDCQSLLALSDQVGLTQVRINNVTTIGVQAFENSGIRAFTATSASDIGSSAFKNCTRLLSVNIPAAPILHVSLFKGDSNLTSVIAPNAITVQDDVFFGCTALSSLSLPAVQYIGNKAFAMTRGLTELKLGPNLTTLGKQIFYDESTDNTVRNWEKLHLYFAGPYPTSVVSAFNSSEPSFGYTDSQNLFMPAMVHVTPANLLGFQNYIPDDWDQYIKEHKLSADWDGSFN